MAYRIRKVFRNHRQSMYAACVNGALDPDSEFYYPSNSGQLVTHGGASHRNHFWRGHAFGLGLTDMRPEADDSYGYAAWRAGFDFATGRCFVGA